MFYIHSPWSHWRVAIRTAIREVRVLTWLVAIIRHRDHANPGQSITPHSGAQSSAEPSSLRMVYGHQVALEEHCWYPSLKVIARLELKEGTPEIYLEVFKIS